jgi:trans-aconitate methyltransferase
MEDIKKIYKEAFKSNGDSPSSVLWPKGRQELRFHALTKNIAYEKRAFSVLDFGCGLAHLKPFLDKHYKDIEYTGVDVVEEFIDHNSKKHKDSSFYLAHEFENLDKKFDYVFASGVFNILYDKDELIHSKQVFEIIVKLFERANCYLAVDFMTDRVDFKDGRSFHANPEEMLRLFLKNISRRVIIDHSYLPYEFSITAFKNDIIKRPDNIY